MMCRLHVNQSFVRFKITTTVIIYIPVEDDVKPCNMMKEYWCFGGNSRLQLKSIPQSTKVFYLKISSSEINDISCYRFCNMGPINFKKSANVSEESATSFFISEDGGSSFYQLQAPHSQRSVVLSS